MRDAVIEPKTDFHEFGIERTYKRPMPVYTRVTRKRPKREKTPCEGCTLSGPELLKSLWPAPEPKNVKVGPPPLKRFIIGDRALSAPSKSEARARYKFVHGTIPPGTFCHEWTHPAR